MPSKSKIRPKQKKEKIGRKLEPKTLLEEPVKRPLEASCVTPAVKPELFGGQKPPLREKDSGSLMGQAIRLARKEKGLSQEELAKKARIDRTTIARVECGIFKTLSSEKLEGIAWALI